MGGGRRKVGGHGAPGARYRDDRREEYLGCNDNNYDNGGGKPRGKQQLSLIFNSKQNS